MNKKATLTFLFCCLVSTLGGLVFWGWVLKRIYHFQELIKDRPGLRMFSASLISTMEPEQAFASIFILVVLLGTVIWFTIRATRGTANKAAMIPLYIGILFVFFAGLWYIHHIEHRYFRHSMYLKFFLILAAPPVLSGLIWFITLFNKRDLKDMTSPFETNEQE